MKKMLIVLVFSLGIGTILPACGGVDDRQGESQAIVSPAQNGPVQPPTPAPTPSPSPVSSAEQPKTEPKPEPKPEQAPAEPEKKPEAPAPAQDKPAAPTEPKPEETKPVVKAPPTEASLKAVSWYYMKKKKGEVPNFPAETKQMKPDEHKAVWVGEGKKVYMTIDVGGELLDYKTLLKALKDNEVKATFFVTGYNLKNNKDYIKLLLEEGHTVGNHTITHKDFTTLTDDQVKKEIADFEKLYKDITGQEQVKYFRFPYGNYSLHLLSLLADLGYTSYFWSTAMKDWEPRKNGADDAYNDIINNLHDGNIILMHQGSKENIEAMDRILKQIKAEGYEFGTLDELQKK